MKVAKILVEYNIELYTLSKFLKAQLKKSFSTLTLNTKLSDEEIALVKGQFAKDKALKLKKKNIELHSNKQHILDSINLAKDNLKYEISAKDKKRYLHLMKKRKYKKSSSPTKNKQVYIKIIRGGLCNPR